MADIWIQTVRAKPVVIDTGTDNGLSRMVAMVEGVGAEYRCYYDISSMAFLIVMWPVVGTKVEISDYINSEQEIAYIPVAAGPGGYVRSWVMALRSISDQATDELLHTEFVGVVAPQN